MAVFSQLRLLFFFAAIFVKKGLTFRQKALYLKSN